MHDALFLRLNVGQMMIFRLLGLVTVALGVYWLYLSISGAVGAGVGASRPSAHRVADGPDCCLIPANRGLHRGQP